MEQTLQGARSPRCNSSSSKRPNPSRQKGRETGEGDASFTLSSRVILDKRLSTLTLENPCPFGPSLRAMDRAKARQMYRVQSAHMARFLHPSDACIHPTPALGSVSEVPYDPTPLILEQLSVMGARRLPVTPGRYPARHSAFTLPTVMSSLQIADLPKKIVRKYEDVFY